MRSGHVVSITLLGDLVAGFRPLLTVPVASATLPRAFEDFNGLESGFRLETILASSRERTNYMKLVTGRSYSFLTSSSPPFIQARPERLLCRTAGHSPRLYGFSLAAKQES